MLTTDSLKKIDRELAGEGRFDPPTSALDPNGQGKPYATYAFAAQVAQVEVDEGLGTVKVLRIVAAHDEGYRVVVVVSAMGKTTDQLLQRAKEISASPPRRDATPLSLLLA